MGSLENLELELDRANAAFYRAFQSLDIRRMQDIWAIDQPVQCIHPSQDVCRGWPEVRDSWVRIFNHTGKIQFQITDVEIVLAGDLAWVSCVENVATPNGDEVEISRILATNLFRRRDGGWKMIHHHASSVFFPRPQSPTTD